MANYHLSMKIGNVGSGGPHSDYILGQGKYEYKKDEIVHTANHLPKWAKDSTEFFKFADENERGSSDNNICKGRSYREVEISLPNELTLEQNKELLDEFVKKELGDKYYYSLSIHDKESSYKGEIQNIHAHVMFCQREIDGIERTPEIFFKQANSKNPEKGGCKKNVEWNQSNKLKELRKDWEISQNKHLEKAGIDKTVSCESLEKQKEIAIQKGDKELAQTLDREAINCPGYILQKIKTGTKLNPEEKIQYEDFKRAREIRDINIEINQLEKMKESMLEKNKEIVELDRDIKVLTTEKYKNEELKDLTNNVQFINLEIIKTEHLLENNLEFLAFSKLESEYQKLKDKFEYLTDNNIKSDEVILVSEKIKDIEENIDLKLLKETKNKIGDSLENSLTNLNFSKVIEENKLTDFIDNKWTKENEKDIYDNFETNFKSNFSNYISLKVEITGYEKELENLLRMSSKENIEKTAVNILSKGEHSKLTKEIGKNFSEIDFLKANIEHDTLKPKDLKLAKEKLEVLLIKNKGLESKLEVLNKKFNSPQMKNQKIRIISSLEKKYKEKEPELLNILREKRLEASLLKNNFIDTEKTRGNVGDYIKTRYTNINLMKDKLDKLKIVNEKIEKKFTNEHIIRLSYNKLTGGKYLNCINSYSKEGAIKEKLEVQIKDLEKSYTSKLFNANEIKKLKAELKVVEAGMGKIKAEFEALKKSVSENKLVEEILKFNQLKSNLLDENKANQKPINNEISDEYKKINEAKLVLEEFPKLEKEKYIGNILNCLKQDDGKVVGSASIQLDKLDRSDEINFD